jgi:vacuolar protein-sorting-associated protein 4
MTDVVALRNEIKAAATQAVEEDEAEKYEKAIKSYLAAAEKLKFIIKVDENQYNKEVYKKKFMEYCERVKVLQGIVDDKKKPVAIGGDDKKDGKNGEKGEDKDDPDGKLKEQLAGCLITEKPNVKWEDVAGLEKAKEALKEAVVLPIKFPQLFVGKRKPWKGILLYGPPGTGKSYLAKAAATETGGKFYSVSAANIVSKWMGESERLVKALFNLARSNKPAVIFIDEIDSVMSARY